MRGLSSVPQPKSGQPSTDINLNDVSKFVGLKNHFFINRSIDHFIFYNNFREITRFYGFKDHGGAGDGCSREILSRYKN